MLFEPLMYVFICLVQFAYWGITAHSAYDMFSWYKYLSVFSHPSVYGVGISFRLRHFLIIAYLYLFDDDLSIGQCSRLD